MLTHRSAALAACLALAAALAGCGAPRPRPAEGAAKSPPPAGAAAANRTAPPGQLARGLVEDVLAQGPPWILRRVPVEEVLRGGNFIGWKILSLPADWSGIDLKVGDVVTKVNGIVVEKPDELFDVWRGLVTAKELRVAYERDGAGRELVLPIAGEPSKKGVKTFEQGAPPRRAAARPRGVTVIEEDDGTPPEEDQP